MKRIAVDIDSTLNHLMPTWVGLYNTIKNTKINWSDQTDYAFTDFIPDEDIRMFFKLLETPQLFRNLPVYQNSSKILNALSKSYDIWIVTMRPACGNIVEDKIAWLIENFPFLNINQIVFTGDKSIIDADYMIDDNPEHLTAFVDRDKDREGICIEQPYNRNIRFKGKAIITLDQWSDVYEFFKGKIC